MSRRILSLWLPRLLTDWHTRRDPALAEKPFVLTAPDHGRIYIVAANQRAERAGAIAGLALADARALEHNIHALGYQPEWPREILTAVAGWCLRYTPWASIDLPDGLWLDITGCAHLFGGEAALLSDLGRRLQGFGYTVRSAIADTPGAAWAAARYSGTKSGGKKSGLSPESGSAFRIVEPGKARDAIAPLPVVALRLAPEITGLLTQLGLRRIEHLLPLPRATLARRFGLELCTRLDQALGLADEPVSPLIPVPPYSERLARPDGVATAEGVAAALQELLARLCARLAGDGKGLRAAELLAFRLDGTLQQVSIGTSRPAWKAPHLFCLFGEKLAQIDPGFGIELFILNAPHVETVTAAQNALLDADGLDEAALGELDDRLTARLGTGRVGRYAAVESHDPERCFAPQTLSLSIKTLPSLGGGLGGEAAPHRSRPPSCLDHPPIQPSQWGEKMRPLDLLPRPEPIDVMALLPDYPPAQFRLKNTLHKIRRADGPERIEPEWWLGQTQMRDYYRLEDDAGQRFWVFRADDGWFLHGRFA